MYQQPVYKDAPDELLHVVRAHTHITQKVGRKASPFKSPSLTRRLWMRVLVTLVGITEWILGTLLYTENVHRELVLFEPRSRSLLTELLKRGVISSWRHSLMVPGNPSVYKCDLVLAPTILPNGQTVRMDGSTGSGSGYSAREAMVPALGELLERYSTMKWDERRIVRGSYERLKAQGAVAPEHFSFFSKEQLIDDTFAQYRASRTQQLGWIQARSLRNEERVLVPAQMAYTYYRRVYSAEPHFWDTTSNGAAAGASFEEAACRALLEAIERDGFCIFWLNRIAPPRISVDTIPVWDIRSLATEYRKLGMEFHVLDTSTELGVPSFTSVVIDLTGKPVYVSVSSVADFDVRAALVKLGHETKKFLHRSSDAEEVARNTPVPESERIVSLKDRHRYWAQPGMVGEIKFFVRGKKRSFDDLPSFPNENSHERLARLHAVFEKKGLDCYFVDITCPEAREAGLVVVRAIAPALYPIHFREAQKYLGVSRLFSVPEILGYRRRLKHREVHSVPHPFL